MHGIPTLITDLALILLLAAFATLLCKKFKQPLVLGYILAGFLCGPVVSFLPTVADRANIDLWSEIGIIFLMFAVGLEFSLHKLVKVGMAAILSALFEVLGMMVLGIMLGQVFGWSMMDSIFLGGMLSISSTMIALKGLEDSGQKQQKFAGYAIGTLIIEDIVAIFLMVILSTMAVSSGFNGAELLFTVGRMLFYLSLWLILGIFILPTFLNKVKGLLDDEMLLVLSLGVCLGMVWIADALGFSSALGAFLAGSILAGTVHAEHIEHLVKPCKDLFGAVFFVSVGLLVVPSTLAEYWLPILLITIVTIVGKILSITGGMLAAGKDLHTSLSSSFCLTQVGEFSYIIASLGTSLGVTSDFLYPIIVAVSVVTAFTTPLMINHADSCAGWLEEHLPEKLRKGWEKYGNNDDDNALQDKDWRAFGKNYIITATLYIIISVGLIMLGHTVLVPLLAHLPFANVICAVIIYVCITPFIRQLMIFRDPYMMSLWLRGLKNRLPLVGLIGVRVVLGMILLLTPLYLLFSLPPWLLLAIGLLFTVLLLRINNFSSMYLRIEARFLANFNEKKLAEGSQSTETSLNRQLSVVPFVLPDDSTAVGKKLIDLDWGRFYGIKVIKIMRGRSYINIPEGYEILHAGDTLLVMGAPKNIENFSYAAKKQGLLERGSDAPKILKDYIDSQDHDAADSQLYCFAVQLAGTPQYTGKTLRESSLKTDWGCFLLGLERDRLPILDPSPDMRLDAGDLVWVLGSRSLGEKLVKEGLI